MTANTAKTNDQLLAEVLDTMDQEIAKAKAALTTCRPGQVILGWASTHLALELREAGPIVVAPSQATVFDVVNTRGMATTYSNGKGHRAMFIDRKVALQLHIEALKDSREKLPGILAGA